MQAPIITPVSFETCHMYAQRSILAHEPAVFQVMSTPEMLQAFQITAISSTYHLEHFNMALTQQWERYGFGMYTLFDKQLNTIIGVGGYQCVTIDHQSRAIDTYEGPRESLEIFYALTPSYIQKGYAHEIIQACVRIAFEKLPFTSIVTYGDPETNILLESFKACGFEKEPHTMSYKGDPVYVYRRVKVTE